MDYEYLKIERRGQVAIVTFDRAKKANALSHDVLAEIETAALAFRDDEESRVVVFTGAGKHFSAGADLNDPKATHRAQASLVMRRRQIRMGHRATRAVREMDQITIAAMKGGAIGGGAVLATAMDFRVGATDCFVSYPEINLGLNLMWLGLPLCVHLVGAARAKRLVILGQRESARTLLDWGFLDEMVATDRVLDRALEMAESYAAQPPAQSQMIKRSINAIVSALDESTMHMDFDQGLLAASSEDRKEGVAAYFEKRKPVFKGN